MRCQSSALLFVAMLATAGCGDMPRSVAEPSDSPSSVPLVVAERSDWYLAIQGRPDKTIVLVTLINRNARANFAYPPTEFRTLEVDPIEPIKAKGHLINEFIAEPVEIKK